MTNPPDSFAFGVRVGLILLAETSAVSACAIAGLLLYIAYSAVSVIRGSSVRWRLVYPAEVYFLNQLSWDLVQAVGGMMNLKWAIDASLQSGPYCSAQASVRCRSSAFIISGYTLKTICFSTVPTDEPEGENARKARKKSLCWSFIIVACLWSILGLIVGVNIAATGAQVHGPTDYWCWIQYPYLVRRTTLDYGFMWFTASHGTSNIVIYAMLFLYFKGYITTTGWRIRLSCTPVIDNVLMHPSKQAYGLLFYPLVYIINVLPMSIARYSKIAHHHVPFWATALADVVYLSSCLSNVFLFSFTRPFLLPHNRTHEERRSAESHRSPRPGSPTSDIQPDSIGEAGMTESVALWRSSETRRLGEWNGTSNSLGV